MSHFNKIFLDTTDPSSGYNRLLQTDVVASILVHLLVYIGLVYTVSSVFGTNLNDKTYKRIQKFLLVVMVLGYFGRLTRAKTLYNAFIEQGYTEDESYTKSTDLIRNAYFTFYFLG